MKRYRLTLAYDGSGFFGWAKQHPPGQEPLRTVQGTVEDALWSVLAPAPRRVHVVGASRTDARVHAAGQSASFDAATWIPTERLGTALNARLPADVAVVDLHEAPPKFDVIGQVQDKQYRYRFWLGQGKPLWQRHTVHAVEGPLDLELMHAAAADVVGEHDFAAFAAAKHGRKSTVRTVHTCHLEEHPGLPGGPELHLVIAGNGFLYNMVRIVAGTLLDIGLGRKRPDTVRHALFDPVRRHAGTTAPAEGLVLEWVRYPGEAPAPSALPAG